MNLSLKKNPVIYQVYFSLLMGSLTAPLPPPRLDLELTGPQISLKNL